MGLNLVEMIMRIEEKFEITIPDDISVKMTTPRIIIDYLINRREVIKKWSKDYVAQTVRQIIEDQSGISRENFTDDSRFIEDMGMD